MVAGLRFRAEQYCQSSPAQSSSATADFGFSYVSAYGTNGLSQSYAGPTATGQSYGTGVAVDSSQKAYTLVQANADVGCGWLPGLLPRLAARPPAAPRSALQLARIRPVGLAGDASMRWHR